MTPGEDGARGGAENRYFRAVESPRRLPVALIVLALCVVAGLLWSTWFDNDAGAIDGNRHTTAIEEIEADLMRQLREDSEARRVPGLRTRGGGVGLLRGRVVRYVQDKGMLPLAGVAVQVLWHRDESEVILEEDAQNAQQRARVVTDSEGLFRFERLSAFVGGVLILRHEPFRPILRRGVNVYRDRETDLGDLVLGAPTTLTGAVLDDKGRPLRRATVQVLDDRSRVGRVDVRQMIQQIRFAAVPIASVDVDDQGQFLVKDLPPGRYVLRVSAPGYTTAFRANVIVTLNERSTSVRVVLDTGAGFVGRVIDVDGTSIPGARLLAVLVPGSRIQRVDRVDATADSEGRYRIDQLVPGNRYFVHAWADGFAPTTGMVVCGDGETERDITLEASGRVEGQIVDGKTGAPIGGAEVTLITGNPINPGPVADVTNAEGRFAFANVRPGPIIIFTASAPGYQQAMEMQLTSIKNQSVKSGETTTLDWELLPGGKVSGQITEASGRPVAHASVALVPRHRYMSEITMLTGADGRYELIGVAEGRYHLRVTAAGLSPIARDDDARIQMPKELGEITKDIVLDTGGTLHGTVLSPDNEPVSGARVFLEAKGSRAVRDRVRDLEAVSGPTGAYRLIGVPPGIDLTLFAEHDAYVRTPSKAMRLGPGEAREVPIALRPGARLELTVVDDDERALEGARIRWGHVRKEDERRASDSFRADELLSPRVLRTDVRGFARLEGLRPGALLIKVEAEGYAAWYRRDATVPEEGDPPPLRAQLVPSMKIEGRVRSKVGGQAIGKAFVYARELDGSEPDEGRVDAFVSTETAADGSYTLEGVAPGAYEVVVWYAPGHIGHLNDRKNEGARRNTNAGARRVDFELDAVKPKAN